MRFVVKLLSVLLFLTALVRVDARRYRTGPTNTFSSGFPLNVTSKIHRLDEIDDLMTWLQRKKSPQVKILTVGRTHHNRPIRVVKLELNSRGRRRRRPPAVWIDCGIHALEWMSPAVCLYLMEKLLQQQERGPLSRFTFFVAPMLNPDGYEYTWNGNRYWRKNRKPLDDDNNRRPTCIGVDPNRNFPRLEFKTTTPASPCSPANPGSNPFSEAESRAVRKGLRTVSGQGYQTLVYLTVHCCLQSLMAPFGSKFDLPKDYSDQKRAMEAAAKAIEQADPDGGKFKLGPAAQLLGRPVGGGVLDWVYRTIGVKYSLALETPTRSKRTDKARFLVQEDQSLGLILRSVYAGLVAMLEVVDEQES